MKDPIWENFKPDKPNIFGVLRNWKTDPQKLKDELRGECE